MRMLGGPGPAPGPVWGHEHHGFDQVNPSPFHGGLCSRFLYTFCSSIATCVYFLSCCWLLQDCFGSSQGDYDQGPLPPPPPRPSSRLWGPASLQPPLEMPGPPGYPAPPGPSSGHVENPFY